METPTKNDWESIDYPADNLDVICARKHFFGKTLKEAESLFADNALYYQEDLSYMPPSPFRYYLHAYMSYLTSSHSEGDTDAASCFLGLLAEKLDTENEKNGLLAFWDRIEETLASIRQRKEWFEWDHDIYGDLEERIAAITQRKNGISRH